MVLLKAVKNNLLVLNLFFGRFRKNALAYLHITILTAHGLNSGRYALCFRIMVTLIKTWHLTMLFRGQLCEEKGFVPLRAVCQIPPTPPTPLECISA